MMEDFIRIITILNNLRYKNLLYVADHLFANHNNSKLLRQLH